MFIIVFKENMSLRYPIYLNRFVAVMPNMENNIRQLLDKISQDKIIFKKHFYERVKDRPITEELVRDYIKKTDRLLNIEEQPSKRVGEKKYKLWIKLSSKYSLIVVLAVSKETLYIITSWNTDKKWQKSIQK